MRLWASTGLFNFDRPAFGILFSKRYLVAKLTRDEMFSERYGHVRLWRLFGVTIVFDKRRNLPESDSHLP